MRLISDGPDRKAGTRWDMGMTIDLPEPPETDGSLVDRQAPPRRAMAGAAEEGTRNHKRGGCRDRCCRFFAKDVLRRADALAGRGVFPLFHLADAGHGGGVHPLRPALPAEDLFAGLRDAGDQVRRFITAAESSFPSARPSASSCARFITFPMSALLTALVSPTAFSMMAVSSDSESAAGR